MFNSEGSNIVLKAVIFHCLETLFNKCSAKIPTVLHILGRVVIMSIVYCFLMSLVLFSFF